MQGQLTTHSNKYNGILNSFQLIAKEEGFRGFFGGFNAAVYHSIILMIGWVPLYQQQLTLESMKSSNENLSNAISIPRSDILSLKRSVPRGTFLDTKGDISIPAPKATGVSYSGIYSALRGIRKTSGIKGLFSGIGGNCNHS
ncbi:hypothetical protein HDV02_001602 [Globomyces sp. JEL0801]|nr:hypothetical protein HDV02_001602 [Globomyces sp. JEL0801]